jgi:hypothetical protein
VSKDITKEAAIRLKIIILPKKKDLYPKKGTSPSRKDNSQTVLT